MEDAYEIGIRLVLENGVSAGMASLQGDLAAYDRALAITTGRVSALLDAAHELKTPASPDRAALVTRGPVAEKSGGGDRDDERAQKAPVQAKMTPSLAVEGLIGTAPELIAPRPVMIEVAADKTTAWPRLPLASEVPSRPPVAEVQDSKSPVPLPVVVPTFAVSPSRFARYAPAFPMGPALVEVPPTEPGSGTKLILPVIENGGQQKSHVVGELLSSSGWDGPPSSAEPAAMSVQAPIRPAPAPQALTTSAAPVAATLSSTPMQGDVYLDGSRVGRWMSDQLAREVSGPQAGITGFDPRLGPAWPGSLHGT